MTGERRRRKGKLSRRARRMLFRLRWGAGAAAMIAIWVYGFWRSFEVGLAFLPAGIVAGICIASALSVPFLTTSAVVMAGLIEADAGIAAMAHRCAEAFMAVGGLAAAWQGFIYVLGKRKIRRDEAGYP